MRSGPGVGDNLSGLKWVMEWKSVLVMILRIPKRKKENSQTKCRKTKKESRATKDHITK